MIERLERFRENIESEHDNYDRDAFILDCELERYIAKTLDPNIKFYEVDAIYYDYSEIPHDIRKFVRRDAYLLIGIKSETAEIITKWIDRWEFSDPFWQLTQDHIKTHKDQKQESKCDRCGKGPARYIYEAGADLCFDWNGENLSCQEKFVKFVYSHIDEFMQSENQNPEDN